jgi:cbb3-type cytochrome oxidase cytochrome c subunit
MKMTFGTVLAGSILIVVTAIFMTLGLSALTFTPAPSDIARPLSEAEEKGRQIYMGNGCVYCHTQYVRPQDWNAAGGGKASRVAQAGDYVFQKTMLLGTERTGPDLSQEGGVHPDDWHVAHFQNPRYTSPNSIMPQFSYIEGLDPNTKQVRPGSDLANLIAYVQSLGQKGADARTTVHRNDKQDLINTLNGGQGTAGIADPKVPYSQQHLDYLRSLVPETWKNTRSAMTPSNRSLVHGKQIYLTNCVGCHGYNGDGNGPAAQYMNPKPFNFTDAKAQSAHSEGQLYHFLLFGLPGSAMPAWGDYLTVNDIWDVINFLRTIPNGGLQTPDGQLSPNQVVRDGVAGPAPAPYDANQEQWYYNPPPPPTPTTSGTSASVQGK